MEILFYLILISSFFPLLLIQKYNSIQSPSCFVLLFLAWIFLVQGDSLVLGPAARLEMGDGGHHFIGHALYLAQHSGGIFMHELAGGTDLQGFHQFGSEYFALRVILLKIFPLWLVVVLTRFLVTSVAFMGIYLFSRHIWDLDRNIAFALGAFFSIGFDFNVSLTYIHGLGIASFPLLLYMLFNWGKKRHHIPVFIGFAILYIGLSAPHYCLPMLWVITLAVSFFLKPVSLRFLIFGTVGLSIIWIANYLEVINAMQQLSLSSGRNLTYPNITLFEFISNLTESTMTPSPGYNRGNFAFLAPFGFIIFTAIWIRKKKLVVVILVTLAIIYGRSVLKVIPFNTIGLSFLSTYNIYLENTAFPFIFLLTGYGVHELRHHLTPEKFSTSKRVLVALFGSLALAMLGFYKYETFLDMSLNGGLKTITHVPNLVEPSWYKGEAVRVSTVPYRLYPSTLASHGFSTFDGVGTLVPAPTHLYWAKGIVQPGVKRISPSWAMLRLRLREYYTYDALVYEDFGSIDLLRIANVGFIISMLPLVDLELKLISGPSNDNIPTRVTGRRFESLNQIVKNFNLLLSPGKAFIYRLPFPLPMIYAVKARTVVPDNIELEEFIVEIKKRALDRDIVMTESEAAKVGEINNEPSILEYRKIINGYEIDLEGTKSGVIVVNTPFTPWWSARNEEQKQLEIASTNMIHMAIRIPEGTTYVKVLYERPLLFERLFKKEL